MKLLQKNQRREFLLGLLVTLISAGVAVAAICQICQGSGTSSFACGLCKGSGVHQGMKCSTCKGKGFPPCSICGGSGGRR